MAIIQRWPLLRGCFEYAQTVNLGPGLYIAVVVFSSVVAIKRGSTVPCIGTRAWSGTGTGLAPAIGGARGTSVPSSRTPTQTQTNLQNPMTFLHLLSSRIVSSRRA